MIASNSTTVESIPIKTGEVPKVMLTLLTGSQADGGRAAGVFTADDLIKILLYVRTARQLPHNLGALKKDLGSDSTGIPGLEPGEIIELYEQITDHANRWTPVEKLVRNQSCALMPAAHEIVSIGGKILDIIGAMDMMTRIVETLEKTTATIPVTSNKDKAVQTNLPQVIALLKWTCTDQQEKSREVLTAVSDYKTEISGGFLLSNNKHVTGLEPAVKDKRDRARKANLDGKITELQNSTNALQSQIDALKKDYAKYVGLAFTGAAGGPIGLAITGGIFGAKAEAARKRKNELINQKLEKDAELMKVQIVEGMLNQLSTHFTDLGLCLLDAEQALTHLEFLWTDIVVRIDHSVDKWVQVNDSETLLAFAIDLESIVNPWKEVGDMSTKLVEVFDHTIEEFRKTYGA